MALNPPPIRIPAKFQQDEDLRAYFLDLHTFLRLLFVKASPDGGIEPEDGPILASQGMANAQRIEVLREAIEELAATIPVAGGETLPHIQPPPKPFNDFLPGLTIGKPQSDPLPPVSGSVKRVDEHYHHSYTVQQTDCLPPVVVTPAAPDPLPAITFVSKPSELEYISTAVNYTARIFQFIEVTSNKTVTLPASPSRNDVIYVKSNSAAGNVTINGGGKNIDGVASFTIPQYAVRGMIYNGTEWMVLSK